MCKMNFLHSCLVILGIATSATWAQSTTLTPCPQEDKCVATLNKALNQKDIPAVCRAMSASGDCFDALEKTCTQDSYLNMFDKAQIQIDNNEIKFGCQGACGKSAENCLADLATAVNENSRYNLKLCKTITTSMTCLEKLKGTKCDSATKKAITLLANHTKEYKFRDLCDDEGNPSKCFKDFNKCAENLAGTDSSTPVKQTCTQIKKYLECVSQLPCKSTLKAYSDKTNKILETTETQYKCPTTGSCKERMSRCANTTSQSLSKFKNDKKNKNEICEDINLGIKCFHIVRIDPVCVDEAKSFAVIEKKANDLYKKECPTTCKQRMSNCANTSSEALSVFMNDVTNKDQLCEDVHSGIKCFDTVRTDAACVDEAKSFTKIRNEAQDLYKKECPKVIACDNKMAKCADTTSAALSKFKTDKNNKKEICKDVDAGVKCFDKVRIDPACAVKKNSVGKYEKQAKSLYTQECSPCSKADKCANVLKTALTKKSISQVCSTLSDSGVCFSALEKKCFNDGYKKIFDSTEFQIAAEEMDAGCDGACSKKAETCIAGLADAMNKESKYTLQVCKVVASSMKCLDNLKNTDCKAGTKKVIGMITKYTKDHEFSDYCDANGNPSQCFKDINECAKNLEGDDAKTPLKQGCAQIDTYLECVSRLTCKNKLKAYSDKIKKKLETTETQYKCSATGTCDERMARCSGTTSDALSKFKNNTNNVDQMCLDVHVGIKCFDIVRKDPVCILKKASYQDYENQAKTLFKKACAKVMKCNNRMAVCANNAYIALLKFKTDKDHKDVICNDVDMAIKCFDKVRIDPICAVIKTTLGMFETKAKILHKNECAGASSIIISTALITMGLAISLFKNYF